MCGNVRKNWLDRSYSRKKIPILQIFDKIFSDPRSVFSSLHQIFLVWFLVVSAVTLKKTPVSSTHHTALSTTASSKFSTR